MFLTVVGGLLAGGMGLFGVGMGLSEEKRSSGPAAVLVTAIMTVVFAIVWLGGGGAEERWTVRIGAAMTVLSALLSVPAWISAAVLQRHPPPADLHPATEEILEEIRRQREQRRREYGV